MLKGEAAVLVKFKHISDVEVDGNFVAVHFWKDPCLYETIQVDRDYPSETI